MADNQTHPEQAQPLSCIDKKPNKSVNLAKTAGGPNEMPS